MCDDGDRGVLRPEGVRWAREHISLSVALRDEGVIGKMHVSFIRGASEKLLLTTTCARLRLPLSTTHVILDDDH